MKKNLTSFFVLAVALAISSCGLYKDAEYQDVSYYQDLQHSGNFEENINNFSPLKVQPGDILGINVNNSSNPEAAAVFNTSATRVTGNNMENTPTNPVFGYKVDPQGDIQLALVGDIKVDGLTTDQIAKQLTNNLLPFLKTPIVSVRILNFKISVLGDVLKPDVYTIQNEHINVNEALSLAGDLNITAKRKDVLLVREEDGKRKYFVIDLTKKELFNSPYYYLHNNDIIYVEPDKTKYDAVSRSYKTNTLVISALSVVVIIISALIAYRH